MPGKRSIDPQTKRDHTGCGADAGLLNKRQWLYLQSRYKLTPRERQIAELICQGLRNGKIANYLRIRPGTVKTHVRNIYRKAQVESKIAMLLRFVTEAKDMQSQYKPATSV
ncbi:MAG: response regulator transcription factor [Phycisphaerales bacterium]|nr:MAG: response regulator transcription factor [Phycisphaerales bacterium]